MREIIKDGAIVSDNWQVMRDPEEALPDGPVLVPIACWQQRRGELEGRGEIGVWIASDESPKDIAADLPRFGLIAVDFPRFADGRGFSIGRELREQHNYRGELRAIGDFMRDQLFYLKRVGFNSFALNSNKLEEALDSFRDFSETYQASQDQPLPLFRRR